MEREEEAFCLFISSPESGSEGKKEKRLRRQEKWENHNHRQERSLFYKNKNYITQL